ncbi:Hypothetical predicted protein, partial [Paramuricea clavata]
LAGKTSKTNIRKMVKVNFILAIFLSTSSGVVEDLNNQVAFEKIGEMASSTSFAHLGFKLHLKELFDRLNLAIVIINTTEIAVLDPSLGNGTDAALVRQAGFHLEEEVKRLRMLMHLNIEEAQLKVYESIGMETNPYNLTGILKKTSMMGPTEMASGGRKKRQSLLGVGTVLS